MTARCQMGLIRAPPAIGTALWERLLWERLPAAIRQNGRSGFQPRKDGQVAQLVEQRTENPRVGSSILPLATIFSTTCIASEILAKALAGVLRELN